MLLTGFGQELFCELGSLSLSLGSLSESQAVPSHAAKLFPSQGKSVTNGNG